MIESLWKALKKDLLAEYEDMLCKVKEQCVGGKKRIDEQEELFKFEESTITPSIIVLGSHDILTMNE